MGEINASSRRRNQLLKDSCASQITEREHKGGGGSDGSADRGQRPGSTWILFYLNTGSTRLEIMFGEVKEHTHSRPTHSHTAVIKCRHSITPSLMSPDMHNRIAGINRQKHTATMYLRVQSQHAWGIISC